MPKLDRTNGVFVALASLGALALAGASQGSPARAPKERRYTHSGWTCRSGPAELVDVISHSMQDLSYHKAIRRMDMKGCEFWWSGTPADWDTTYWESRLPSGEKIYVARSSGFEHIFCEGGSFDSYEEGRLAREMSAVTSEWYDEGRLQFAWVRELSAAEVDAVREEAKARLKDRPDTDDEDEWE